MANIQPENLVIGGQPATGNAPADKTKLAKVRLDRQVTVGDTTYDPAAEQFVPVSDVQALKEAGAVIIENPLGKVVDKDTKSDLAAIDSLTTPGPVNTNPQP